MLSPGSPSVKRAAGLTKSRQGSYTDEEYEPDSVSAASTGSGWSVGVWRIYLDVCCLNRPFNDQTQERIRLEAEAVLLVVDRLRAGDWRWISSEAVGAEIDRTGDVERRGRLRALDRDAHQVVVVGAAEEDRARGLLALGFQAFDALHLACAESGGGEG